MKQYPLEELLPKAGGSAYALTRMAAIRALELAEGKPCLVERKPSDKVTSLAIEEIAKGKVVLKEVAEQFAPREDQTKEETDSKEEIK